MSLPIRLRLTLWYGALLAAALLLFAGIVYAVMANALLANLDAALSARLDHVVAETAVRHNVPELPHDEEPVDVPLIPVALIGPSGAVLHGPLPRQLRTSPPPHTLRGKHFETAGNLRVGTTPVVRANRILGTVVVWQSLRTVNQARQTLLLIMLATGPALLLIALLGGWVLASRALRPVAALSQTAGAISAGDLSRRVPVGHARDELSALAATFNAMIDRLEGAVKRERRFTSDASHELRSPLAIIRAEATLALERERSPEEYRRVLEAIDEQATGMEELVMALLTLARVEGAPESRGECLVAELVEDAIAEARPPKCPVGVEVEIPPDLTVQGNSTLLTRALRNLIENAIRFSPSGEKVQIRAFREGTMAIIDVSDRGPGIAPEHRERLFEPFYQVQTARTPGASHGLGLSICRRIVEAHGGTLRLLTAEGPGTTFRIELPVAGWSRV